MAGRCYNPVHPEQLGTFMPLPRFAESRPFYQAAKQRFLDAQFLFEAERTTASVYLAGYVIECTLKALVLSAISNSARRAETLRSFRGARAHDFEWLMQRYREQGGSLPPKEIARDLSLVTVWSTDMRYNPGTMKAREAAAFLKAAERIMSWADGRM
ncbi:MAG: HEPN domain-containing protein [Planctomycetia bacterium]|nr:HEPN domain-containing protein [Planctomycetia bacterium]